VHHKILFIFSPFVPEVHGQNKEITVNLASAKTQISLLPTQARSGYMFFISFPLSSRTINRIQGGGVTGRRSYCSLGGETKGSKGTHLITETCQKRVSNCQNSMAEGQFTAHASSNRLLPNYQLISTAWHVWEGRLRFTISEGRMVAGRI
jgi:hypothetical protein